MKILKRNYGHRNLIIFLILSMFYLQAISSLSVGRTLFSFLALQSFFIDHYLVFALTLIASFMVIKIKKFSEIILMLSLIVIVGKSFILLSASFNKLTLVLNFVYLVFAFYFFITWELEVALASFNPKFNSSDLEKESRFRIKAIISANKNGENAEEVIITNIDEGSCFLLLSNTSSFNRKKSKKYFLESTYEGVCFRHTARLVSSYDRGIGLVFDHSPDLRYSWSELYKVCLERGLMG